MSNTALRYAYKPVFIKCKGCATEINKWDKSNNPRTYCSKECYFNHIAKKVIYKSCSVCKKLFTRENSKDMKKAKFCSKKCMFSDRDFIRRSYLALVNYGKEESIQHPTI